MADLQAWNTLLSVDPREAEDRQALAAQLVAFCQLRGVEAAGLYSRHDGEQRLAAAHGRRFPEILDDGDGLRRLPIPLGHLVHDSEVELDPEDPEILLLAAAARLCRMKRHIQEQSFQAMFRGVELEALYDVGLAIAATLDLEELGEEVLLRAVSLLDARRGALYLIDDGRYRLVSRFGGSARETFSDEDLDVAAIVGGDGEAEEVLPAASHMMAAAVEIHGDPRGLLVVGDKESRTGVGPFPPSDRRTLDLFATQAAIALENAKLHRLALEKERLEREMELAAEIQKQLLPEQMPEIPGFEVLGWNRPARQIGGDYFDFQGLGEGQWVLVVGDVTGKGMPAALLVSTLHSALHVLLDRMDVDPSLIQRLNRHIFESSAANKFITMLMASLDTTRHRFTYLNAGHNPGLLLRRDGEVLELSSAGLPLGLLPLGDYGSSALDLEPGDLVCLYSDGITECEAPDEEQYGLERLVELLRRNQDRPLQDIITEIDCAMIHFAKGEPQGDDQTVVLLRRVEDGDG
ncbi:MAG: SpoIIE family protein phosphatase [Acidobacteriota bacterium]